MKPICSANIAALGIGRSFHASAVKFLGKLDVFICNSLVSFYAKCGSMEDGLLVFNFSINWAKEHCFLECCDKHWVLEGIAWWLPNPLEYGVGEFATRKILSLDPEDVSSYIMLSNAHSAAGRDKNHHQMNEICTVLEILYRAFEGE
ncbi:hypothetical protein M0R45_034449 [Rubus argutus]|uniref:Uncharacterized protein n=1 Tax=Rubus argutus TaxID=59490 RepID=A0AAW1VRZ5_RUBAR